MGKRSNQAYLHMQSQMRQKVRDQVRERFARYGDKSCARIVEAAMFPQGMRQLMERLGMPATAQLDQQLDALSRFLSDHGPNLFLKKLDEWERRRHRQSAGIPSQRDASDTNPGGGPIPVEKILPPKMATKPASGDDLSENRPEWFDPNGNYIGPERRKNRERRSGDDRRDKLDSVMKNKRFGGDRRKEPRRRDDRVRSASVSRLKRHSRLSPDDN